MYDAEAELAQELLDLSYSSSEDDEPFFDASPAPASSSVPATKGSADSEDWLVASRVNSLRHSMEHYSFAAASSKRWRTCSAARALHIQTTPAWPASHSLPKPGA